MSILFNSYLGIERVKRYLSLWFGIAFLTILCHTANFGFEPLRNDAGRFSYTMVSATPVLAEASRDDKKPKAKDDDAATAEENPVQFNILINDESDDVEQDADNLIDVTSVDLDPDTETQDKSRQVASGIFAVNTDGDVVYTPSTDFFGESKIEYTVNNLRGEKSNKAKIRVAVAAVNDAPVITGQTPEPVPTNEDEPLTITFNHLIVTDVDNTYPNGFTLAVGTGSNYTLNGNQIIPAANYSGSLSVPVTVNDGTTSSNQFILNVVVNAVNDAPVIADQTPNPIPATEDQSFSIALSNLTVTDVDNTFPTGFTLQIQGGANYTVVGSTITPASNFYGALSIPVTVSDGAATSNTFNVQVTVTDVNDVPVITGQTPDPLLTDEDEALTITLTNLIVTDPDDTYPTGFSLSVSDGDNYSVAGTTITPDADFAGVLNVAVTVSDGQSSSDPFVVHVTVAESNDVPDITGQSSLVVDEDNAIIITLAHLIVTDTDDTYPANFTLTLASGANYSVSGNTVTPALNFSGALSVPVTVNDGQSNSAIFPLSITVSPVNDKPVITAQTTLATAENVGLMLTPANFFVTDPDDTYPSEFTLIVNAGTNYSVSGTTVTPAPGFNGTLTVGVQVNDGTIASDIFNTTVSVSAVNDPPVITGNHPLTLIEDNSITPVLTDLEATDSDDTYPVGFTLTVLPGTNYTVSGNTVSPAQNFNGTLSVGVQVNDGEDASNVYQLPITVSPVNDAPSITSQVAVSILEDQSATLDLAKLIVNDPDNNFPTGFTLVLFPGTNYTLSGNTVTPVLDFRGTLSVPVQVSDGLLTSNIFQFQIAVTDVNDTPVITGQTPLSTNEDTPVSISLSNLTVFDPDNTYPTGFTLAISGGTNYTVSGNTITPALNFNGTLNISVSVNDGTSTSTPFSFQIQVGDSNDPPVITAQTPLTTNEETPITLTLANLTVADPDNTYPTGFSLIVAAGENYTFQNSVITPLPNFVGSLTVPVRVNDGVNNSPTFNVVVQITAVNDAPSFSGIPNQTILENGKPVAVSITGISKGPGEDAQQLTFTATSDNTAVIPNPAITYGGGSTAQLAYTLVPNAHGVVTITVTATDSGPMGTPHQNTYTSTFQINVAEVNNAPTLDNVTNVTMSEDAAVQTITLSGVTAGAGETQNISIEIQTDKPALFETLSLSYTSPQSTGTLLVKPAANSFGVATVTVKVVDNGSNTAPSVNSVSKSFTVSVQSVNDVPVFVSTPVVVAAVGEPYEYLIQFTDIETPNLAVTALNKPAWATLFPTGNGRFRLAGTPPASAQGETGVELQVKDSDQTAIQQFKLVVNNRPVAKTIAVSITEDNRYTFSTAIFSAAYSDLDQHPLTAIQLAQLPPNGKLILADAMLEANDTISVALLSQLQYQPDPNYDKPDVFFWKAFDGFHFSSTAASVDIKIQPVNDPPVITVAQDTLQFDVTGVPMIVSELLEIEDPDNDSLTRAEIIFSQNHDPQFDQLILKLSGNVRGIYEPEFGRIVLTGLAPISDYTEVIRQLQYNYLNTIDPELKMKILTYTVSDAVSVSEPKVRLIDLKYTFIELEIPTGFTPNGDQSNDLWVVTRPGGLDQLTEATIRVLNRRGVVVFEAKGFDQPWDGTLNGQALPADSYFFSIDLNLRSKKTYRGVITILR